VSRVSIFIIDLRRERIKSREAWPLVIGSSKSLWLRRIEPNTRIANNPVT